MHKMELLKSISNVYLSEELMHTLSKCVFFKPSFFTFTVFDMPISVGAQRFVHPNYASP